MLNVIRNTIPESILNHLSSIMLDLMPDIKTSKDRDMIRNKYPIYMYPSNEIDAGCIVHVKFDEVPGSYDACVSAIAETFQVDASLIHIQDESLKICKLEVNERIHPHIDVFNDCTLSCMFPLTNHEGGVFHLKGKPAKLSRTDVAIFNRALEHEVTMVTDGPAMIAFTGFKLLI